MSNTVRSYFLAPTWHSHPESGPIQLGNILVDLKGLGPEKPLYRGPTPPPPKAVNAPPGPGQLTESWQTNYEFSAEKLRAGKFGIWTKFLSFLGLGVDLGYEFDNKNTQEYTFDRMETSEFYPTESYIEQCLQAPVVARLTARSKTPLYIMTGVKAVRGAKANTSNSSGSKAKMGVEVDGTVLGGAPVSMGPEGEGERKDERECGWDGSSDFVFAYRVQKITINPKTGAISQQDYLKGAMLDKDGRDAAKNEKSFTLSEFGAQDLAAQHLQEDVVGDGEGCIYPSP